MSVNIKRKNAESIYNLNIKTPTTTITNKPSHLKCFRDPLKTPYPSNIINGVRLIKLNTAPNKLNAISLSSLKIKKATKKN